ncbi:MAG TPA: hypothetical protein VF992_00325 [Thermoplasmata archaeon]
MLGSADPVAGFERAYRRKTTLFTVAFLGTSAFAVGALGYFVLMFPEEFPPGFIGYAVVEPVLLGLLLLYLRRQFRRVFDLARALAPRLKAAGVPRGSGPTFVFDNGLVIMWTPPGPQFYLVGSPAGGKALPSMEDLRILRRGLMRMRRLVRVDAKHGPDSLRHRLEEVRVQMMSKVSWLFVFAPRPAASVEPTRATWFATVFFARSRARFDAQRILQQIDPIARLLEDAVETARAEDTAGRTGT